MSNEVQRTKCANELFNLETRHKMLNTAITKAKEDGVSSNKLRRLQQDKNKTQKSIDAKKKQLLKHMVLACNVQPTSTRNWQYIRYATPDHSLDLIPLCIRPDCIDVLITDNRTEPPITMATIMAQLALLEDRKSLEEHASRIIQGALIMLHEEGIVLSNDISTEIDISVSVDKQISNMIDEVSLDDPTVVLEPLNDTATTSEVPDHNGLVVSYHACQRWIERILNITSATQINSYYKANVDEVRRDIKKAFSADGTKLIWVDNEGIKYYINSDNLMFVVGSEHGSDTIITLYEVDYGFSKHINSMVIKEQAKVLEVSRDELDELKLKSEAKRQDLNSELYNITDEMSALKSKLKYLEAEERLVKNELDLIGAEVSMKQAEFNKEYNKLFKKWKANSL